jgi:hypothetical protein
MNSPTVAQKRMAWLLWGVPLWLAVSAGIGLWYYYHREKMHAQEEQERFAQSVSVESIADDLHKIVEVIGERNSSSEKASANLSRTASMVEGLLGPSNMGYVVNKIPGPGRWPILHVSVKGKDNRAAPVWIISSYDSPQGSAGAQRNATGLVATLAAAQAVAGDTPDAAISFFFLPHANDATAPIDAELKKLADFAGSATGPRVAYYVNGGVDHEIADKLAKLRLPAIPFTTVTETGATATDALPDPARVAAAAERLVGQIHTPARKSTP